MKEHFAMFARYNQWANAHLYDMAAALPDEAYRRDVGACFGSLHGTLNHILTADRIWMRRITGTGEHPRALNTITARRSGSCSAKCSPTSSITRPTTVARRMPC